MDLGDTTKLHRLDGKVAVVTGASRGIGEAIATAFAAHGAKVVLAARKIEALETVAGKLRAAGHDALAVACHTGDNAQVEALFSSATARFGQVDILVNNAATNPYFGPMLDISDGALDKTFEVNVKGYFACARACARHLLGRNAQGSIINIASVAGLVGSPFQGVYAMTKAAVISMTKTLAVELGGRGIRVNAIAPGVIETRFASALITNDSIHQMIVSRTPMARHGQPIEVVGAALLLASAAGSYMNGTTLVVDGGMTIA